MSVIRQYLSFCVLTISFSLMSSRLTHAVAYIKTSVFMTEYFIVRFYHILPIYLSVYGLGLLPTFDMIKAKEGKISTEFT